MGVEMAAPLGEEDEKGHHQAKELHGLREGKAQNGVGEELLLQRRVPGITKDETPKHSHNSSSRASHPYCGSQAPMNLAAVSVFLEMALVWKLRLGVSEVVRGRGTTAKLLWLSSVSVSGHLTTAANSDRLNSVEVLLIKEGVETNVAQAYIFRR